MVRHHIHLSCVQRRENSVRHKENTIRVEVAENRKTKDDQKVIIINTQQNRL